MSLFLFFNKVKFLSAVTSTNINKTRVFLSISRVSDIFPATTSTSVNSNSIQDMSFCHNNGVSSNQVINTTTNRGQIQVIYGPMFSGKTTELIRRLKRFTFAQYRCLIIKYLKDTRYSNESIATHDGQSLPAASCTHLSQTKAMLEHFDVIGIDEGQFFPDVVSFSEEMANSGKIVIVAALDGDFQRTEFGKILQLVPLAESVVKLTAVCMSCFHDASFTKRISNEQEVEIIGGADKYMSVCRECHRLSKPIKNSPCKIEIPPIQMNYKPNFNI